MKKPKPVRARSYVLDLLILAICGNGMGVSIGTNDGLWASVNFAAIVLTLASLTSTRRRDLITERSTHARTTRNQ